MVKFQRTKFRAYVKLGKNQKSKRKYRKATGRHNKTRQKWKSRPPRVEIGYKNEAKKRGLINGKKPVMIKNIKDIEDMKENQIAIISKMGDKKKQEIAEAAQKKNIEIVNLNVKKFLRKMERKKEYKQRLKEAEKKEKDKKKDKKEEKKQETKTEEKVEEKKEKNTEDKAEENKK